MRAWSRQRINTAIVGMLAVGIILSVAGAVTAANPGSGALLQPMHGWSVCAVLEPAPIPGETGPRQRFELCRADGWRILAYCLDPGKPPPGIGTGCSELADRPEQYWCGDAVQGLKLITVLQEGEEVEDTPTPTLTATQTATLTATATPTPGATGIAGTATSVAATATAATATAAFAGTATSEFLGTRQPSATLDLYAETYTPTPFSRIRPGGRGSLDVLVDGFFTALPLAAAGMLAAAGLWSLRRKRRGN